MKAQAWTILIAFLCPLSALAASDISRCSVAGSHAGQRACLVSMFEKVEAQLSQMESDALKRINQWDEDLSYRRESKDALIRSNAAFRQYRRAQCGLVHSLAAGGNGAGDMQLDCSIELTDQRIKQLKDHVLNLEIR